MYDVLKMYDEIVKNYYKTIIYLENKLNSEVMEYSKQQELRKVLDMLELKKGDEINDSKRDV